MFQGDGLIAAMPLHFANQLMKRCMPAALVFAVGGSLCLQPSLWLVIESHLAGDHYVIHWSGMTTLGSFDSAWHCGNIVLSLCV